MTETITDFIQRLDAAKFDAAAFGGRRLPEMRDDPEFVRGLARAQQFVNRIQEGRATLRDFKEAMTTSDFPILFATNLQRQMLGMYRATPVSWPMWARGVTVNDFREADLLYLSGGDTRLTKRKERAEAKRAALDEGKYTVAVDIYERVLGLSEEQIRNDDLNAFASIPARFGRGARRTEEYLATSLIADDNGPNAAFFNAANGNFITRELSEQGLHEAADALATQTDRSGEPIYNEPAVLAVVPALRLKAMQLIRALQVERTMGKEKIVTTNMFSDLQLAVLYYAPTIMSSANSKTSWFVFADPNLGEGAAAAIAHLRGLAEPGIYSKAPDAVSVTGAGYDIVSFDTNDMQWKVKHVVGGTLLDPRFAVGSNGTVAAGA